MIIISKYLVPKNYIGLTIYPFVFLKNKELKSDSYLLNHENIHLQQQKELFWVFFFVWYFAEYLVLLIKYKNHNKAYKNISFEKEAYQNEGNLNYLLDRKKYSFTKYIM
ncbi:hypothetical protein SAMN05444411_10519 [Lutibacter oricola]|uniref:DUF4157 domain-containing protein n=1 Tax=Lutibacter oricola TaxID=762486 RepID=A0A1H3B5D5_9FLAO|nr:hypothetical protein [Lutibacter oricola]SDX36851.1 hypothetical protein SAMN05444411_10519 [Lutibacter oricola]